MGGDLSCNPLPGSAQGRSTVCGKDIKSYALDSFVPIFTTNYI